MPSPEEDRGTPAAPRETQPDQRTQPEGHLSPQIDESTVKPDQQIAEMKEQSSGQATGQS